MTVTGKLELVAFDAADTERLAAFYAELAGWKIVRDVRLDQHATGDGQQVGFQPAPDHLARSGPVRNSRSSFTSTC